MLPLVAATKNKHIDMMGLLLKNGANINGSPNKDYILNPLWNAIQSQNLETVKFLVWKGAKYVSLTKTTEEIRNFMESVHKN